MIASHGWPVGLPFVSVLAELEFNVRLCLEVATAVDYDVPVFDPFTNPGKGFYFPSNQAADLLMRIQFAYEDISSLFSMMRSRKEQHEIRLLLKYAILEWCSLDKSVCQLAQLVLRDASGYSITRAEKDKLQNLYRDYRLARRRNYAYLKTVRDKITAHRDEDMPLQDVADLWASIEPSRLIRVLKPIPPFFNFIKQLNVYVWSKRQQTSDADILSVVYPLRLGGVTAEPEEAR